VANGHLNMNYAALASATGGSGVDSTICARRHIVPDNKNGYRAQSADRIEMTDLVTTSVAGLPSTERSERMAQQARASKAERTWRAYGSDWQVWETWAATNGAAVMPADPERVAEFLSDMTASRKLSTVRRYLASLSVTHTLKGHVFERKHASIKTILRGAARGATLPRRVRPLLAKQVRALLRDLGEGPVDLRDAALLALGVASGCRRSEIVGLDWAKRGTGSGVIEITDEGANLILFCSKTVQDGEPETIHVQPGIALKALKRWVEAGGIIEGSPLFRPINKAGMVSAARLTDGSIARIVKARCAAAGLEARDFAGHSLRAGMVTSAAENGVPEWRIRLTSRHKSEDVLRQYIRPVEKRQHALTRDIGL
jgi:integrase